MTTLKPHEREDDERRDRHGLDNGHKRREQLLGTAAEVIGLCSSTIGEQLYTAKVYFQTADLFAWTAVIVLLSVLFEGLFLRGVDALTERWCA